MQVLIHDFSKTLTIEDLGLLKETSHLFDLKHQGAQLIVNNKSKAKVMYLITYTLKQNKNSKILDV